MDTARALAEDPLFEIENHGANHRPLSIAGKGAYGIAGTASVIEAAIEVEENAELLKGITGRRPLFFRSGTNHYDEIAVAVAAELGHRVVGYTVNGDGGASFSRKKIAERLLALRGGEIVLFHMNRPGGWTAEGIREAIPRLREKGFRFVRLSERPLVFLPSACKKGAGRDFYGTDRETAAGQHLYGMMQAYFSYNGNPQGLRNPISRRAFMINHVIFTVRNPFCPYPRFKILRETSFTTEISRYTVLATIIACIQFHYHYSSMRRVQRRGGLYVNWLHPRSSYSSTDTENPAATQKK